MNNRNILLLISIALTFGSQVFGMEGDPWNIDGQEEQEKNSRIAEHCPYCTKLIPMADYWEHVRMEETKYESPSPERRENISGAEQPGTRGTSQRRPD